VASVLDGAENVLAMFFTNSSSALRRVKTKERIKRRQKERVRAAREGSVERLAETAGKPEEEEEKLEVKDLCPPPAAPSSPAQRETSADASGTSQWSPISLSEITEAAPHLSPPAETPGREAESRRSPGRLGSPPDPAKVTTPSLKMAESLFSKRRRQFVYTVQSPKAEVTEELQPPQKAPQANLISGKFIMD